MSVLSRWRGNLATRRKLLDAARRRHEANPTRKTRATLALRKAQVAAAERVVRRHTPRPSLKRTIAFDGVPVFRGLARMLDDARDHGWNGRLNSADRRKGVPEKYGRLSQVALYAGWLARKAGFNPANPPGRSTHELRSDGVAYRGPVGRPLSWWQLGMDVTNAPQLRDVLNRLGYHAFRPYSAGSEAHHVNLKRSPYRRLKARRRA